MRTRLVIFGTLMAVLTVLAFRASRIEAAPLADDPRPAPVVKADPVKPAKAPVVQLAILLDTSGSMSGLIDQARTQIWGIVNALSEAKRNGVRPKLQIALYAYGESGFPDEIHLRSPFTDDLDFLSRELFSLSTTGGFEPVGTVVDRATRELAWSDDPDALKLIYVAGNEEFTQGSISPYAAAERAKARGIVVNAVNCGDSGAIAAGWQKGAAAGGGTFFAIDHNHRVIDVAAPQDAQLAALNATLNNTYVPYGANGTAGAAEQKAQDNNASGISGSTLAARTASKSSGFYRASKWDLVDAVKDGTIDLAAAKDDALPAELKGKGVEERKAFVEQKQAERAQIQQQIASLSKERTKFVEAERKKLSPTESLDSAIIRSVKDLGARKSIKFE